MGNPSAKVAHGLQLHFLQKDYSETLLENLFFCDFVKKSKNGISELWNFLRRSPFGRPTPVWGLPAVVAALKIYWERRALRHARREVLHQTVH